MKPQHRYIYEKATWKMEIEGNAQKIAHDSEQSAYSETKQINNTNEKHNQKRESINPKPKTKMKSASLFGIKMLFMRVVFPSNNILCLLWTHTDSTLRPRVRECGRAENRESDSNKHSQLSQANQPKCRNLLTMPIEIRNDKRRNILTVVA